MTSIPQTPLARNLTHTPTTLLVAQRDWLRQLLAQHTASPAVPALLAELDAELARRTAQVAAALAGNGASAMKQGIVQRPSWAVAP